VNCNCLASLRKREKQIDITIWFTTKWFPDEETIFYLNNNSVDSVDDFLILVWDGEHVPKMQE
jgi:hypothetical protein